MNNEKYNILLAKWLENDISEDELTELNQRKEFETYSKIAKYSSEFYVPGSNEKELYNQFLNKTRNEKKNKTKKISIGYWGASVAAAILLLFGVFQMKNSSVEEFTTMYGEQLTVFLPDSSEVLLNSNSKVSFSPKLWSKTRKVNLKGEAYFKVKKGEKFKVISNEGEISVLGTAFNVNSQLNFLEVKCYEGKVLVSRKGVEHILVKNQAIRQIKNEAYENWNIESFEPIWKNGEISFDNTPLKYVVNKIQDVFGVLIKTKNIDLERRFSGSFSNSDLTIALVAITDTMGFKYEVKEKEVLFYK